MTRQSSAKKQRIITAADVTCKKLHARNGDQFLASNCYAKGSTDDTGTDTDQSLFNSLTQSRISASKPNKQRPRNPKKQRARQRPKTLWYEKVQYQRRRCNERLKPCQITALHDADYHARCISLPLNLFLTVRWQHTAIGPDDYLPLFQAACKRMDAFCRRRGFRPTWLYVHEAPDGKANTHFLVHVPRRHQSAFKENFPDWFEATDEDAIDLQVRHWRGGPDKRLAYMCKGTDIVTASRIGGRAKRQGDIPFKRCGTTGNIGPAARARFRVSVASQPKSYKS